MSQAPASGGTCAEASASWTALGTGVHLVVTSAGALAAARRLLEAGLAAVDAACSRFRPDSEIVALDGAPLRRPGMIGPVAVSPLLAEAIGAALRAAALTGGDVDPTVGEAVSAAGYDRDFALVPADGPAVPLRVRQVPGWQVVQLDTASRELLMPAGVVLDLGATAKAWAADRAAVTIAAQLGCGVLVSLGGDVAVAGEPPPGGWRIRVQDVSGRPQDPPPAGPSAIVAITAGGLATSSTSARRWRRGGNVLHHILDPRTGLPAEPVWRTVSVAAGSCLDANTASTAAIIKGRAAPAWLARAGLPARLVAMSGAIQTVGGWPPEGAEG